MNLEELIDVVREAKRQGAEAATTAWMCEEETGTQVEIKGAVLDGGKLVFVTAYTAGEMSGKLLQAGER